METKWAIPTNDGKTIYGVKSSDGIPKTRALFIVHGLTGNMNEYLHKRAADYFLRDYDVYRFNLYDGMDDARNLEDCTLQTHADDLNTVLGYFGHNYQSVFLIGHSYGGPTIMIAQPQKVTAASLWDPTYDAKEVQQSFTQAHIPGTDLYKVEWGSTILIGKAMHDEAFQLNEAACIELAKAFPAPVQVITAGNGYFADKPLSWHSHGKPGSIRIVIPGTEHCFYEENTCDELLAKTDEWLAKF